MATKNYKIEAGKGLGDIIFGLTRQEVEKILGKPSNSEIYSYTGDAKDDLTDSWTYYELEMCLSFDQLEDWRLTCIAVDSDQYSFNELIFIGMDLESVKVNLRKLGVNDLVFKDYATLESPTHQLIESNSLQMNFWFDHNHLSQIQLSPFWMDEENIKWPKLDH